VIEQLMVLGEYQLKFVVEQPDDIIEIDALLGGLSDYDPSDVLLMPQGVTPEELAGRCRWLAELCNDRGFRFCPRLQIMIYGNTRGR